MRKKEGKKEAKGKKRIRNDKIRIKRKEKERKEKHRGESNFLKK